MNIKQTLLGSKLQIPTDGGAAAVAPLGTHDHWGKSNGKGLKMDIWIGENGKISNYILTVATKWNSNLIYNKKNLSKKK